MRISDQSRYMKDDSFQDRVNRELKEARATESIQKAMDLEMAQVKEERTILALMKNEDNVKARKEAQMNSADDYQALLKKSLWAI